MSTPWNRWFNRGRESTPARTMPAPKHQWRFNGNARAAPSSQGVNGNTSNVMWDLPGRSGQGAVHLSGKDDSFISFGRDVGQFGRAEFTVSLWLKTSDRSQYDLVGNRSSPHESFFSICMLGDSKSPGTIIAEVNGDAGTSFVQVRSDQNWAFRGPFNNGSWHHVVVVRQWQFLDLYIDGVHMDRGTMGGAAGATMILNQNEFKLGRSLVDPQLPQFSPDASFEDLRIYEVALSATEVSNLHNSMPPDPQPVSPLRPLNTELLHTNFWNGAPINQKTIVMFFVNTLGSGAYGPQAFMGLEDYGSPVQAYLTMSWRNPYSQQLFRLEPVSTPTAALQQYPGSFCRFIIKAANGLYLKPDAQGYLCANAAQNEARVFALAPTPDYVNDPNRNQPLQLLALLHSYAERDQQVAPYACKPCEFRTGLGNHIVWSPTDRGGLYSILDGCKIRLCVVDPVDYGNLPDALNEP